MRDRISPRRKAAVGPQKVAPERSEPHLHPVPQGLPLRRRIEKLRRRLDDLLAGDPRKKRRARRRQVRAETAPEADEILVVDDLHRPN